VAPEKSQLRIFEVESDAISHDAGSTEAVEPKVLPEWHSIRLDAQPSPGAPASAAAIPAPARQRHADRAGGGLEGRARRDSEHGSGRASGQGSGPGSGPGPASGQGSGQGFGQAASHAAGKGYHQGEPDDSGQVDSPIFDLFPLHVAPIEDRLMAGIVDVALVLIAFLLFVLVFAACTTHLPTGKSAIISAGMAVVAFFLLYQWLFFTYADSTPGMRYARIALCTFDDENPTREALRWRIGALFLSAIPLGLGFLWALLDEDHLGWHDRISKTYQRSYR
jgi:uncharacterized RDD family membrane protein YckC